MITTQLAQESNYLFSLAPPTPTPVLIAPQVVATIQNGWSQDRFSNVLMSHRRCVTKLEMTTTDAEREIGALELSEELSKVVGNWICSVSLTPSCRFLCPEAKALEQMTIATSTKATTSFC